MNSITKQTAQFLDKVTLFNGLNSRQLDQLAKQVIGRNYEAGQTIVIQGSGGEGFFVVQSGNAEAVLERADGTKSVVNTFGPTQFFGELALLDDGPRTASVIATEATRCLVLTRWDFLATLREDSEMAIVILQELARRFRQTLGTFSVPQPLKGSLRVSPNVSRLLPIEELASELKDSPLGVGSSSSLEMPQL